MPQESDVSVLVIEDDPDAARLIQHVLEKGTGRMEVAWAEDLASGLECLAKQRFHAVLLDLNLPDSSGFETFAKVRQNTPEQALIVLTGQDDEALATQAVRGGADDYLIKSDIRDRFLAQRIRYAVERHNLQAQSAQNAGRRGKIITFTGAKGGAGTTTLVSNVAAVLASLGSSVVVIEFMPEIGSMAAMVNRSPSWEISMLFEGKPEGITRDAVVSCLEDFEGGFRVLCGPKQYDSKREVTSEQARRLVVAVRGLADFILVDLPSLEAQAMEQVLQQSASTLLVLERNRIGLRAAKAKLPVLQKLARRPDSFGVVLVNKTPFVEFLAPVEFSRELGCSLMGIIPPAGDLLGAADQMGLTVLTRPDTPFSQSVQELARRLRSQHAGGSAPPAEFAMRL